MAVVLALKILNNQIFCDRRNLYIPFDDNVNFKFNFLQVNVNYV